MATAPCKIAIPDYSHIELSEDDEAEALWRAQRAKERKYFGEDIDTELTAEEEAEALREARRTKHFRNEERKYWQKVNRPVEYARMDAPALRQFVLQRAAKEIPGFQVDAANRHIINLLSLYFSGDPAFETQGYSLAKGILLLGPVGCGKTSLMRLFSVNSHNSFVLVPCRTVSDRYTDEGAQVLRTFSTIKQVQAQHYFGQTQAGYCFDDLGTETTRKHYGNESNVLSDIIFNRYDQLALRGKTHFTANLSSDEIEQYYGARVRSRLREMCNVLMFDAGAGDRRG